MNRMLLAGVLAVTAAVATPALAQPAENAANPQTQTQTAPANEQGQGGSAQAAPGQAAPEQAGAEQGGGGGWMHQRGGWGMRGAHMMMQRRWMMRWDPQQRCIDRLAWRAARGAYIEAKLGLSDQQQPLWDKVQSIAQGDQRKERALCQSLKPGEDRTVLDRMNRAEQFLAARLDALRQAKPAVQALYQALTPEQQAIMDHPFRP